MVQETLQNGTTAPTRRLSAEEVHHTEVIRGEKLMSEGKRHLICGNVPDATNCFSQACEIFAIQFGQTSDQLATPYLYYGKALLEMGRIENGVLGHAVEEGNILEEKDAVLEDEGKATIQIEEVEMPESERQELVNSVQNAMREGNLYNDHDTEDEATEDELEHEEENEKMEQDEKMEEEVTFKDELEPSTKEENVPTEESSLQLAWETLELSTVIYKRLGPAAHMKLAEAKHALAQVSMETEHYSQAVGDFTECLEYQKQVMPADDRRIAETYYNIGLAHSFDNKFAESLAWYQKSVEVLKQRISNLEQKLKVKQAEEFGEVQKSGKVEDMQKELEELKDIVMLDMVAKIEDIQASQNQYSESIQAMKSMGQSAFPQEQANPFDGGFSSSSGDFTEAHPVATKKRKNDDLTVKKVETTTGKQKQTTRCDA